MLLDVAQGLTDIAIAPADLSLPDGVFGERGRGRADKRKNNPMHC